MLLFILLSVLAATLMIVGYLIFIWWLDRYEREPFWLVFASFLWGGLGGTCLSCVINSSVGAGLTLELGPVSGAALTTVAVAPIVEEAMKGAIFLVLILTSHVDNRTDGLIYGAAAGLGFAAVENLWYYAGNFDPSQPEALLGVIFMRTLFTALVHCISSAMLGMAVGYARHRAGALRWVIWPVLGYIAAVFNHAVWNGLATTTGFLAKQGGGGLAGLAFLLGCALVVGAAIMMFALTQMSLHAEHKVIRKYLRAEAERGTLPDAHAEIIPYWRKRWGHDWLPDRVDKDAYVRAATLLAFRHHQLEIAEGERAHQYREDIALFRQEVRSLLRG